MIFYVLSIQEKTHNKTVKYLERRSFDYKVLISDFLEINMKINDFKGCRFLNLLADIDKTSKEMQNQILEHKTKLRNLFKTLVQQYSSENLEFTFPNTHDTIYLLFEAAIVESKVYKDVWPILTAKKTVK